MGGTTRKHLFNYITSFFISGKNPPPPTDSTQAAPLPLPLDPRPKGGLEETSLQGLEAAIARRFAKTTLVALGRG